MYLCYVDESGTPEVPGASNHFVLAGISVPIWQWHNADKEISNVLSRHGLGAAELHTGWMLRNYLEQSQIDGFGNMSHEKRRSAVMRRRAAHILELQKRGNPKMLRQTKKNYSRTAPYIHLTKDERIAAVRDVADCVSSWDFARLFAECIDKINFDTAVEKRSISEQAFEQVVTRFDHYMKNISINAPDKYYGLIIHDNNQSVAMKHTRLMRQFHKGAAWREIKNTVETPLFVDSSLTRMIQIADLCCYALRRFCEKGETDLFNRIYKLGDRPQSGRVVGVRHYTRAKCACEICRNHG